MARHVTEEDVRALAAYARIGLADQDIPAMTEDLNDIIDSLKPIIEYDLQGVEPTFHPAGGFSNVMREDIRLPGFTQEEALSNASKQQGESFLVPRILDGGVQ